MAHLVGNKRALLQAGGILPPLDFKLSDVAMTPGMRNTLAPGPFYTAPIVQGDRAGANVPDVVSFPRGTLLGNQTDHFYSNFDPYQGSAVKWWTPENNDGDAQGNAYVWYVSAAYYLLYNYNTGTFTLCIGTQTMNLAAAVAPGTTYCTIARFDANNTMDGTNYGCLTLNNADTFGITTQPTVSAPAATMYLGSDGTGNPANAILEGVTWYRRVLRKTYGTDVGNAIGSSELVDIYAAGAGADPCLITGGEDVVFCLPTDSTPGALTTGDGNAWSWPHGSNVPDVWGAWDGGYLGGPFCVELDGAVAAQVNCGSHASVDNLPANPYSIDMWLRVDVGSSTIALLSKGNIGTSGYELHYSSTYGLDIVIYGAGGASRSRADASLGWNNVIPDGKYHLVTAFFNQGVDDKWYLALDGRWTSAYSAQEALNGAYQVDAANDLKFGNRSSSNYGSMDGGLGWVELSNNDRHGGAAGTDFIPPRAPYNDGNTIDFWPADEGTGATMGSNSGNNDGTITGSWSATWDQLNTPVVPQGVTFNGTTTNLDATSGANIDNLPSGANGFSAEGWFQHRTAGESSNGTFWNKTSWYMRMDSATTVRVFIDYDTTDIDETFTWTPDGILHHWMLTYNENGADRFARVYRDGVLVHTTAASVGAYVADAASTLYIGNNAGGTATMAGGLGWQALSDVVRAATTFVPGDYVTPRANDANMHLRYAMTDGAGASVADTSGNAYTGTLTNYVWTNTPDLPTIEPGGVLFDEGGYLIGADGANDGLEIEMATAATTDYFCRPVLSHSQDGNFQGEIQFWNIVGAALLKSVDVPKFTGTATAGSGAVTLEDTTARWPQSLIGIAVYNITAGTAGTVSAVSGDMTQMTTDIAFANTDVYFLQWADGNHHHPWVEPWVHYNAALTRIQVRVVNTNGLGTLRIHQVEVLESLLANGDHESLDGGFPGAAELITGWANNALDAGDTEPEAVVVHTGAQSLEWNVGASLEGMAYTITPAQGSFVSLGGWFYGTGTRGCSSGCLTALNLLAQFTIANYIPYSLPASWRRVSVVARTTAAGPLAYLVAETGAGADRWTDDVWAVLLDPITLTVTPASAVNSLEGAGIRIDGNDNGLQTVPTGYFSSTFGWARWSAILRHGDTESVLFGNVPAYMVTFYKDANNYISVEWSAADTLRMSVMVGGVSTTGTWATGGSYFTPGVDPNFLMMYTGSQAILKVDGTTRITVTPGAGIAFGANYPNVAHWGTSGTDTGQSDLVIAPPT